MKKFFKILFFITIIITLIFSFIIICRIKNKSKNIFEFSTIQNIQEYASLYPENVNSDNNDWEYPTFAKFYVDRFSKSFFDKILEKTCLIKKHKFNPIKFKKLLEKVTNNRLLNNIKKNNHNNLNIKLNTGDKIIIFGDVQAALHSIARDLQELKNLGFINDNLKITKDNLYIIFMGDVINKNPYSLETLSIILSLMNINPDKVIYNRGEQETNEYWENLDMTTELKLKIEASHNEIALEIPLKDEINKFFDTLGDTIIITNKNNNKDKIIITHSKCKPELLDSNTKLILLGEKNFDLLKESSGLELFGYDQGAATWSLLSCPTATYQKFFNFHKDAFVELTIGKTTETSTIALYNHDIRENQTTKQNTQNIKHIQNTQEKNPIYKKTVYNPIFGYEIKNDQDNILSRNIFNIGSTMSLTGITGPLGNENKIGLETALYLNNINNKNNSLNYSLIKPVIFNDDHTPKIALSNVKKLIKNYSIDTLIIPTGNITLLLYLDMVKTGELSVLFPCDGGSQFRNTGVNSSRVNNSPVNNSPVNNSPIKNIVHFRPSYSQELKSLINYLVKEHGIKSFAFFYQDDSYGEPIVKEAHEELKKLGITKWLDLPHLRTESDFGHTIKELRKKMPEAIGCFSSHFSTQEFINQLGGEFFPGKILFGLSFLYSQALEKFLKTRGIKSIFSMVVPDPINSQIEIVKEFREHLKVRGTNINSNTLEGYIAGSLLIDAINNITKPFTKEKIIEYFENMKNYNFKGLILTFNPETRDLSQPVWIKTLNNRFIKY